MPDVRRTERLTLAIDSADALSLGELRQLENWLHGRIEDLEAQEEIPTAANRVVVEERQVPTATFRREPVKCGKERCRRCANGPVHGHWYAYWKQDGRTRSKYIGK